jgi:hypothetical protein
MDDPQRPDMKHVALDLSQSGEDLEVSHGEVLGEEKQAEAGSKDKRRKLKKIKGE